MEHMGRNRHRRRSYWAATEEEGSSSLRIRRPRLSPEPSTISEPAVSLPSFAEGAAGEETEPSQIVGEETAEPSHAVASETIELRQGGVGNVDYQDKLLFFAYHTVLHGTSTAELGRMMMLIEVATGRAADIGVADITRFVDNLKSDLRLRKYVFCSSCFRTLVNKRALCPNSRCELYRIYPKRSKTMRRPSLSLLDIRPQMETVLSSHLSLLINVHRRIHESHFDCLTRSEAADFPMFKHNVESSEEFSRHIMTLQLTIATDGFIPARLSRSFFWRISEPSSITSFSHDNLKRLHIIKRSPPFKACGPDPSDIWNFAHRTSNVSRKPDLQDLPEAIVNTLNEFVLDALDLGNEDLQGYRLDTIKSSRSGYWISLGKSEEEREKRFKFLLQLKTFYCSQVRICIAEALEDVRYYRFYQGKLVPSKKYKTISQAGFGREDKARMTKSEWRRQALHMKEI